MTSDPDYQPGEAIDSLQIDSGSANRGTPRGRKAINHSLREFGFGRSIVLDNQGRVIAGNHTLENARELGAQKVLVVKTAGEHLVAVQRTDLDLDQAKARGLAIADNRTAELNLQWDREVLQDLAAEMDLSPLFSDNELEKLVGLEQTSSELDTPGAEALERAEQLQQKWGTACGQLWEIPSQHASLGSHRLSCADSTDRQAMHRLMGGQRADLCITDPPWNVDVGGGDHGDRKRRGITIANDHLPPEEFREFLSQAMLIMREVVVGDVYIFMASAQWPLLDDILRNAGFHWSATLIWVKQTMVLTRRKYHARFEPIWYGWHQEGKSSFCAGRDQDDVWQFDRPTASPEHPTMKPRELIAKALFNSSQPGNLVFEPFSGSGTTLVAAETTGRLCYANELLPKYVAVGLERLALLGLSPKLVEG